MVFGARVLPDASPQRHSLTLDAKGQGHTLPLRIRVLPGRRMAAVHDRVPQRLEILRERNPEGGSIRGLHARERGEDLWSRRCL